MSHLKLVVESAKGALCLSGSIFVQRWFNKWSENGAGRMGVKLSKKGRD